MKLSSFDLLLGILVTVMWGCNFVVIGLGLEVLDPFVLTFMRFLFCALPAVFFVKRPAGISWTTLAVYGVLFGCGLWWVVNFAMYNGLSAGMASLFMQFSAFFTIALCFVLLKETVTRIQIIGSLISVAGLLLMIAVTEGSSTLLGILLVLLGSLVWSVCNVIVKLQKPADMLAFVIWTSLFSAPAIFVMTVMVKGIEPFLALPQAMNIQAWFSVLFQAYVTTILGYMTWNNLLKKYPATAIAPLSLLVPIAGIMSSYWFYNEHIGVLKGIAMFIILLGLAVFMNAARLRRLL